MHIYTHAFYVMFKLRGCTAVFYREMAQGSRVHLSWAHIAGDDDIGHCGSSHSFQANGKWYLSSIGIQTHLAIDNSATNIYFWPYYSAVVAIGNRSWIKILVLTEEFVCELRKSKTINK